MTIFSVTYRRIIHTKSFSPAFQQGSGNKTMRPFIVNSLYPHHRRNTAVWLFNKKFNLYYFPIPHRSRQIGILVSDKKLFALALPCLIIGLLARRAI